MKPKTPQRAHANNSADAEERVKSTEKSTVGQRAETTEQPTMGQRADANQKPNMSKRAATKKNPTSFQRAATEKNPTPIQRADVAKKPTPSKRAETSKNPNPMERTDDEFDATALPIEPDDTQFIPAPDENPENLPSFTPQPHEIFPDVPPQPRYAPVDGQTTKNAIIKEDSERYNHIFQALDVGWTQVASVDDIVKMAMTTSKIIQDRRKALCLPLGAPSDESDEDRYVLPLD